MNTWHVLSRPSIARVYIEIDLLKTSLACVWIGLASGNGIWQDISYEDVPPFCSGCLRMERSVQNYKKNDICGSSLNSSYHLA